MANDLGVLYNKITIPFTVHRRYFLPRSCDRVELPTRVEILQPIKTSNYVDVLIYDDRAMVRSRPLSVFFEYPRPSVGLCVVCFDNRSRTATTPSANGE
ncbi:unnamed protein product [Macrosiphum euphorbiae]|uniref:Uncharacterized protein n=1 Tax=Macrosiphum euphorbiae TaxID=13131 RepID=A0AAV0WAP2_9HEMI|nr:unnamed protein product [Macrosiphum euphorbiae]